MCVRSGVRVCVRVCGLCTAIGMDNAYSHDGDCCVVAMHPWCKWTCCARVCAGRRGTDRLVRTEEGRRRTLEERSLIVLRAQGHVAAS